MPNSLAGMSRFTVSVHERNRAGENGPAEFKDFKTIAVYWTDTVGGKTVSGTVMVPQNTNLEVVERMLQLYAI